MPSLKILICGGGIAGNALAFWLCKGNHDITLIERTPELRSSGLQIDLRGHGIEILKRMGLEQAFRNMSAKEEGLEFINPSGKVAAYFPANKSGEGKQSFTSDFEIMRGDLVKMFNDEVKDKIKCRFGIWVESLAQTTDKVTASFSDGTSETFDLVVGADGNGSHTRRMMIGPDAKNPVHYIPELTAYFTLPWPAKKDDEYRASVFLAPGGRFVMIRRSKAQEVQVYLTCRRSSKHFVNLKRGDIEAEKAAFKKEFAGMGWKTQQVLDALDDTPAFYCERPGVVRLDSWSNGRVAVVGDAAYCPTLNTGMGTTSSVVGAYIMAGEINKASTDIRSGLESYEKVFKPFMTQVQRGVTEEEAWWSKLMYTWLGLALLSFVLGWVSWLKLDVLAESFFQEDVIDWTLPEYSYPEEKRKA